MDEVFRFFDTDGTKDIDLSEWLQGMKKTTGTEQKKDEKNDNDPQPTQEEKQKWTEAFEKVAECTKEQCQGKELEKSKLVDLLDILGRKPHGDELQTEVMSFFDVNSDGKISLNEFLEGFAKVVSEASSDLGGPDGFDDVDDDNDYDANYDRDHEYHHHQHHH